ncbi:NUDIX hydrolase [Zhihengliuella salsuginis]|uniref:ADP-ribose pyrophosphatase n=1 Tax=Zhihengliuella salsuginis TaxID=578222 RepID=A0ABQ3GLH1_9MICC|nr:NUDIX hydrolase [Zhihengliuella salsuginis]GHD13497.1 ADP-ribose pyrophosphatase [Zhihengliuella salsuginis]
MPIPLRSSDDAAAVAEPVAVVAAGVLPWRRRENALEVLLIHRDRYDDWSWPKGKLDAGESIPECAVREVREEVGLDVALGLPLPAIRYEVKSGPKVVYYWAALVDGQRVVPDGDEVDAVKWVSVAAARRMLTSPSDQEPLDALERASEEGDLETLPFVVVRHAKAKPRSTWTKEEGERPLAATGQRQAIAVANVLEAWSPSKVVSSPWTRCVQTVSPYLMRKNMGVKLANSLTEHAAERKPAKTMKQIIKQLDKQVCVAICTHRPVLPYALEVLASRCAPGIKKFLPSANPYLDPGSMIVAQQSKTSWRIVSVEVIAPFGD